MNARDPFVRDFENYGEQGYEPEITAQLCQQSYDSNVCQVAHRLLLTLLFWKCSNHSENRVATEEYAKICDVYHQVERLVTRQVAGHKGNDEVCWHRYHFDK